MADRVTDEGDRPQAGSPPPVERRRMRALRIAVAGGLALALFLAGAGGLVRRPNDEPAAAQAPAPEQGTLLASTVAAGPIDATIAALQDRLRSVPDDWRGYASLGLAYVQEARVTADPAYYPKAEGVLERSLELQPDDNPGALVGMAALAAARHDFEGALAYGERARRLNPYDGNVYGVIGDALVELGRYGDAFDAFQRFVDLKPGLASYARVSYARELQGDVEGAIGAMRAAMRVAPSQSDAAWAGSHLGELFFNEGRLRDAAHAYQEATLRDPEAVLPLAGLAKVAWARGDLAEAIDGMQVVVGRYPSPEYVWMLGDLQTLAGEHDAASRSYDLVRAEADLLRTNGVNTDLETALFDAEHGDERAALATARAEWGRRHSVHVADALAWALHANGRDDEAARYAGLALRLGSRSATFLYHAGMIELARGHESAARAFLMRAMDTNPHFSVLDAPTAARALARLGGGR